MYISLTYCTKRSSPRFHSLFVYYSCSPYANCSNNTCILSKSFTIVFTTSCSLLIYNSFKRTLHSSSLMMNPTFPPQPTTKQNKFNKSKKKRRLTSPRAPGSQGNGKSIPCGNGYRCVVLKERKDETN